MNGVFPVSKLSQSWTAQSTYCWPWMSEEAFITQLGFVKHETALSLRAAFNNLFTVHFLYVLCSTGLYKSEASCLFFFFFFNAPLASLQMA